MSVLLANDQVELYPPSTDLDEHGWRLPGDTPYWQGIGSLQLQAGLSNPRAIDGGGRGPYGPARDDIGVLYLPPEVPLLEGTLAEVRGRQFVLSQTRIITDPTGAGVLDCWAATATTVDTWPNPGGRA